MQVQPEVFPIEGRIDLDQNPVMEFLDETLRQKMVSGGAGNCYGKPLKCPHNLSSRPAKSQTLDQLFVIPIANNDWNGVFIDQPEFPARRPKLNMAFMIHVLNEIVPEPRFTEIIHARVKQLKVTPEDFRISRRKLRRSAQLPGRVPTFAKQVGKLSLGGNKNMHHSGAVETAFAIASPGGLIDGVEACQSAIHDRKIHIHACLHQLGADDANCIARLEPRLDRGNHIGSMLSAHKRREMDGIFRHGLPKVKTITTSIYDAKHLLMLLKFGGQRRPIGRPIQIFGKPDAGALEFPEKAGRVGNDLPGWPFEISIKSGLSGSGEDDRHPVITHEAVERLSAWKKPFWRQELRFIKNHHAVHEVVKLSTPARLGCIQGLEKLDIWSLR